MLRIIADFVNYKEEKHIKALIALPKVDGYSRQAQFDALLLVLRNYSTVQKVGAMIGNNSSTNDTLAQANEAYLLKEEGLKWEASFWQTWYMGHIINLAVQAFLFHNVINIKELESYNKIEKRGEQLSRKEEVA